MKPFFRVMDIDDVLKLQTEFDVCGTEIVALAAAEGRILAATLAADVDIPGFARSTMDGYAVRAASTFGASEGSPAFLKVVGKIGMGEHPTVEVGAGEAVRIATGGMLPRGADAVVMVEHTEALDDTTIEAYKSVAPGQYVVEQGEDIRSGEALLEPGRPIRPQEAGLLAAIGAWKVTVFSRPKVGIISTGDEVVPVEQCPKAGQIRDINTTTLAALVSNAGGLAHTWDIVPDDFAQLHHTCRQALAASDMVLISGGSSVGTRDFTIEVIKALDNAEILVHGVSIRPGKPTILGRSGGKPIWGLPGHVTSAMVVFSVLVKPFLHRLAGRDPQFERRFALPARLTRNLPSVQGKVDFIRVRVSAGPDGWLADPIMGKSGLIRTMVLADGLVRIDANTEGLDKDAPIMVDLF